MTQQYRRRFEKLERQKRTVLDRFAEMPQTQMRFRPEPHLWSAADVLDHLMKVERSFLLAARKHLSSAIVTTLGSRARAFLLIGLMRLPIRVKVPPAAAAVLPQTELDYAEALVRWDETRGQLADFLELLQPAQKRLGLVSHPVSGWMTMDEALAFLCAHITHHEYQLKRLRTLSRVQ